MTNINQKTAESILHSIPTMIPFLSAQVPGQESHFRHKLFSRTAIAVHDNVFNPVARSIRRQMPSRP